MLFLCLPTNSNIIKVSESAVATIRLDDFVDNALETRHRVSESKRNSSSLVKTKVRFKDSENLLIRRKFNLVVC